MDNMPNKWAGDWALMRGDKLTGNRYQRGHTRPCVSRATAYTRADHDAVTARTHVEFARLAMRAKWLSQAAQAKPGCDNTEYAINSNTIFITASIDNSQLGHWLNQDDLLPYLLNIINNASIDIGKIDEIFIIFGESEINKPNKSYLNRIHTIIEILKEKVANVKIFLSRSTYCKGKYSKSKIDLLTSIDLGENVYLFPNTDELQKKYRYDNCHYNKEGADKVIKLYSDFYNSIN